MIPAFDDFGRLPSDEHTATWEEIVERFGWNPHRRRLLDGLADGLEARASAGYRQVWLSGSFVTSKGGPAGFDANWDIEGVDLSRLTRC